ncbi:N-acetylglucosamine-6-phosphate deacetylase [Nodularia spumigena CS-591/04]|uniref:N-acetylglucosamine-6-phosphate deacetylase n=1 Tax=Nodularia spumigena TaxID=70799 RepID=UPI00232F9A87|nr:N-acetylglucosamine-6-phosphate deacetylase [Nodularia spumigena]MDB9322236.1 N-acetylglucosamine-6-phosphate deacetylase [Nodularia spumigena CS-591/07A]MDB9329646.1 N-acetylglucosamine-6-phosphate deacetylase [Nodularia spumigena CS-591/04]MDB9349463.1 N-acetylglucosamine-6-phosphate deacetylase [Nodularia spumigena CS-588/01]MDB9353493.1 N-acetylglucosamine-6-phosphate deacetylase [Nodularia spumigena CS-588/05]
MIKATQNPIDIINARVPSYQDLQRISVNHQGIIEQILPMSQGFPDYCAPLLDVAGDWISLGGVDLQINGALGLAFPDLKADNAHILPKISQFLWDVGVDGFLPTLVTTSVENIQRSLAIIANIIPTQKLGAKILGVHLEGPFLNYQKRGAHPAEYLLPLTIEQVNRVLGDYAHIVKVITLAPELDSTGEVIPYLRSLGIIVSLGHSQATATQAQAAFKQGATMVTHAFNAMPPLHHREPGLLGAAITHPDVICGFIADGEHVTPTMLQILLRASKQAQGLFLVSDALAPLGLPDGVYPWDSRQIEVKNGTARLLDGTLSGTTLSLLLGVQNLVKWGICDIESAINLATNSPRKAINLPGIISSPAANLLRWYRDENTKQLTWHRLFS